MLVSRLALHAICRYFVLSVSDPIPARLANLPLDMGPPADYGDHGRDGPQGGGLRRCPQASFDHGVVERRIN